MREYGNSLFKSRNVKQRTLEEQKEEIKRYASDHDMNVDKWVTDVIVGKGKEDERNLAMVLDRMQKGDSLVLFDISRLGRTLSEVMEAMSRCMEKGIQIYSIKDRYILDNTLDLPVMGDVFKLVAEIEHNLMSTRTKEALDHRKKTGGRWDVRRDRPLNSLSWI